MLLSVYLLFLLKDGDLFGDDLPNLDFVLWPVFIKIFLDYFDGVGTFTLTLRSIKSYSIISFRSIVLDSTLIVDSFLLGEGMVTSVSLY